MQLEEDKHAYIPDDRTPQMGGMESVDKIKHQNTNGAEQYIDQNPKKKLILELPAVEADQRKIETGNTDTDRCDQKAGCTDCV
jgi:hypothetical protein